MGLAPGSGPDRQSVYVFYDRVENVAMKHAADTGANTPQILGHAIAHEIGHLLLNVQTHSAAGITRGDWNLWDLWNASYGYLLFATRQAKARRAGGLSPHVPNPVSFPISGYFVQVFLGRHRGRRVRLFARSVDTELRTYLFRGQHRLPILQRL